MCEENFHFYVLCVSERRLCKQQESSVCHGGSAVHDFQLWPRQVFAYGFLQNIRMILFSLASTCYFVIQCPIVFT